MLHIAMTKEITGDVICVDLRDLRAICDAAMESVFIRVICGLCGNAMIQHPASSIQHPASGTGTGTGTDADAGTSAILPT